MCERYSFAGAISLISVGILLSWFRDLLDELFNDVLDGDSTGVGVEVGKNTVPHDGIDGGISQRGCALNDLYLLLTRRVIDLEVEHKPVQLRFR